MTHIRVRVQAAAAALNASMSEMQVTLEERLETLSDAVNRDFGESMAKVVSDLETGMGALEEKVGRTTRALSHEYCAFMRG